MSGVGRNSPYFSHENLIGPNGETNDTFRKWFQSMADINNEYFVAVRREAVLGVRSGQPRGVFQNTRLTTAQRDDLEPVDLEGGMQIFNTTTNKLQVFDGTNWVDLH